MRRKITPEVLEAARKLAAEGYSVRDVAEKLGVGKSQLAVGLQAPPEKAVQGTDAQQAPKTSPARPGPLPVPAKGQPAALAATAPRDPSPPSQPPDPFADVRRILKARNPGALRELEDGLAVLAAGGEAALVPWLARPAEIDEAELDPLITLGRTEAFLREQIKRMGVAHPQMHRAATSVTVVAKARAAIAKGRPEPESEDELQVRTRRVRGGVLTLLESTVSEEESRAAKLGVCITCERVL